MNTYAFDLDLGKRFSDQVVAIGQSDHNGTTLTVTLYKDGTKFTTTGLTAYFAMRLPGESNYYRKSCTYSAGVITCVIDEEYAGAVAGRTDVAYFELHQGSSVIASTARFLVIVLPSATHGMTEGYRYDDEVVAVVRQWLDEHPEATTTVTDDSLTTAKLKDKQITEPKMADNAISTRTIIDASVTTAKLADASVTTDKLGGSSVTTAKLDNLSVTEAKLASDSVTRDKVADSAIGTSELASKAVTTDKLADSSVTADKLDQSMFRVVTDAEIAAMLS